MRYPETIWGPPSVCPTDYKHCAPQRSPALPGGAEEATTESDEEDQHLHWHLHALLRSLCDHKVSLKEGGGGRGGGERETLLAWHTLRRIRSPFVLLASPEPPSSPVHCPHFLPSASSLLPLHTSKSWKMRLADLVISNMPLLCCCCCISTFLLKFDGCISVR